MTLVDFIKKHPLDKSLLIGYYGGGNYGDELLQEVLLNLFEKFGVKNTRVFFLSYIDYDKFHERFKDCKVVLKSEKLEFIKSIISSKNIIIGGGGIWGLDFNRNVMVLSMIIIISRYMLFKRIYLVGIGFYSSTSDLGKFFAQMVGRSCALILARDIETWENFGAVTKRVILDKDIVLYYNEIDEQKYDKHRIDLDNSRLLDKNDYFIFLTPRRFCKIEDNKDDYIEEVIKNNPEVKIILSLLEIREVYEHGYQMAKEIAEKYDNVIVLEFDYNPVALVNFFKQNRDNMLVVSPQLHGQIVSHISDVKFLPITYDNKNTEFLKSVGIENMIDYNNLSGQIIQDFIEASYVR